jgi:hypothetical protein
MIRGMRYLREKQNPEENESPFERIMFYVIFKQVSVLFG